MLKNLDKISKIREQKGNFNREIETLTKYQMQKKGWEIWRQIKRNDPNWGKEKKILKNNNKKTLEYHWFLQQYLTV